MTSGILPSKLLFPKQPYHAPRTTRAHDARKPIRRKPGRLSRWLTEKRAITTIGLAFLGSITTYLIAGNILPGALA